MNRSSRIATCIATGVAVVAASSFAIMAQTSELGPKVWPPETPPPATERRQVPIENATTPNLVVPVPAPADGKSVAQPAPVNPDKDRKTVTTPRERALPPDSRDVAKQDKNCFPKSSADPLSNGRTTTIISPKRPVLRQTVHPARRPNYSPAPAYRWGRYYQIFALADDDDKALEDDDAALDGSYYRPAPVPVFHPQTSMNTPSRLHRFRSPVTALAPKTLKKKSISKINCPPKSVNRTTVGG